MQYHVDGELVDRSAATVHVEDRGFRYGDGAFETVRAYGGEVFAWEAHRRRLRRSCESLGMPGAVPEDLRERIDRTLGANGLEDAYVRASVTRGVQPGKLTPRESVEPTVVVQVDRLPRGGVDGDPVWDGPARVRTVDTRRTPDASIPAGAKTHNYLDGILARVELREAPGPADEALLCDVDGDVAEGATSNLFFVADGTLKTPAAGELLPGITRKVVLELADEEGIDVERGRYDPAAVRAADEAFLTNTTWEVRPVESLDGHPLGEGPVTRKLRRRYDRRVERECYG